MTEPVAWIDPREITELQLGANYVDDVTLLNGRNDPPENKGHVPLYLSPEVSPKEPGAAIGGQWIAVTERLPEVGRYVLVYEAGTSTEDIYIDFLVDEAYWSDTDHVTHWMPLPLPPTEASPEARGEQL